MIISDSTTLIILLDLGRIKLLSNIFSKVYVPQSVFEEVTFKNHSALPEFMEVIEVEHEELLDVLLLLLDKEESEAIVLAKQKHLPLIIDEKKGRKIAINLNNSAKESSQVYQQGAFRIRTSNKRQNICEWSFG